MNLRIFYAILMTAVAGAAAPPDRITTAEAESAVRKFLPVLGSALTQWEEKKLPCASCHHQALGLMTISMAGERGLPDERSKQAALRSLLGMVENGGSPEPIMQSLGPAFINPGFDGYIEMGLEAAGRLSVSDAALMGAIANRQTTEGRWRSWYHRPPSEDSDFTATALSIWTPQKTKLVRAEAEAQSRIAKAAAWLLAAEPRSTEDHAFRLLGLGWAGVRKADRLKVARQLLRQQRADGGWAQLPSRGSDAYATGVALAALREGGLFRTHDASYQQGLRFLLDDQKPDGSWMVETRHHPPMPGNPFSIDSFPNGRHQFISIAGSNWAAMALLSVLPKVRNTETVRQPAPDLPAWAETALLGTPGELRALLDAGLDPNTCMEQGTTLLMMSSASSEKVRLLLDRGAGVNVRAASGATALSTAVGLAQNTDAVRLLLNAGADVNVELQGGMTLLGAAVTGEPETVALLLDRGCDPNQPFLPPNFPPAFPLQLAVGSGNTEMVRLLVSRGANVNGALKVWRGAMPPLSLAVEGGQIEMVRLLISLGADVNQRDAMGMTPLLWAAIADYGDGAIAEALLAAGADRSAGDKSGATPLDLSRRYKVESVVRLLSR